MNEKTKKYLVMLAYRSAVSVGIFIILFAISFFAPNLIAKISPVWTKNTNFQKLGNLLLGMAKELFPF